MVSIRPDIRSYARISYLREIHGDYPGAIEAMKLAIGAGVPGDETSEWARVQLGKLYEHTGQLKEAEVQYRIAEEQRPQYAFALEGLARVAEANKNYTEAASLLKRADAQVTGYGFRLSLSRIYTLLGEKVQAENILKEVIKEMKADAEMELRSAKRSYHADQELAEAYLMKGDVENALKHAITEYERRPGNIEVNEQLAWTYYQGKQYTKAHQHIQTALSTGSKNPTLLHRAGLISAKIGDTSLAKMKQY
jgi:tetratricopeptide (TPR) repeat protein